LPPTDRSSRLPHADEERGRGDERAGQLDEDREPGGLHRPPGGAPGVALVPQPQALGGVDPEDEPERQADDGDDEEADDTGGAPDEQGAARRPAPAAVAPGEEVLDDLGGHDGDHRDGTDGPAHAATGDGRPDDDGRPDEEPAARDDLDDRPDEPDDDDEQDDGLAERPHQVSATGRRWRC